MSDLISRQAAIELWEKYHPTIAVDAMQYDTELRQLPSAEPKQQWIPCSERLPEVYKTESPVGIYMKSNPILVFGTPEYEENAQFCIVAYCDDLDGNVYWSTELDAVTIENVTAWMPLPEPYQEAEKMNITKNEAIAIIEMIRKTRDIEEMQMIVHAYEKMLAIAEGKEEPKSKGGRKSLDRQKIMDYYDKGRTEEQIAELVGCHRQTVRRILKETGKLDEAKLDTGKVMALHQAGWSVKDIAGEMGCSIQYIEKTLQEKDQKNESEML